MTKKQRAEVVEMLRCVVDAGVAPREYSPGTTINGPRVARDAIASIKAVRLIVGPMRLVDACLEAAQLIEEGWTP